MEFDSEEVFIPVQDAAEEVLKTYGLFTSGNYEIFSHSLTPFEEAQQSVAALSNAIRNALHKIEDFRKHIKDFRLGYRSTVSALKWQAQPLKYSNYKIRSL